MDKTVKLYIESIGLCETLKNKELTINKNEISDYIKALSVYLAKPANEQKKKKTECKEFVKLLIKSKGLPLSRQQEQELSNFLLQNNNADVLQLKESLGNPDFSKLLRLNSCLAEKYVEKIYEEALQKNTDENKIKELSEGLIALITKRTRDGSGQEIPCFKNITAGILKLVEAETAETKSDSYKTKLIYYVPAILNVIKSINLQSVDDETRNNLNQIINKYFDFFQQQNAHLSTNDIKEENQLQETLEGHTTEPHNTIQYIVKKLSAIKSRIAQIEQQLAMFTAKPSSNMFNVLDLLDRENLENISKLIEEFAQLKDNYESTYQYKITLLKHESIMMEEQDPRQHQIYLQGLKNKIYEYLNLNEEIDKRIKPQLTQSTDLSDDQTTTSPSNQSTTLSDILNSMGCTLSELPKTSESKTQNGGTTYKQAIMYNPSSSPEPAGGSPSEKSRHVANIEGNTIEILDNDPKSNFLPQFIIGLAKSENITDFSIDNLNNQQIKNIIDYFTNQTEEVTLEILENIRTKIKNNTHYTANDKALLEALNKLIEKKKKTNRQPSLTINPRSIFEKLAAATTEPAAAAPLEPAADNAQSEPTAAPLEPTAAPLEPTAAPPEPTAAPPEHAAAPPEHAAAPPEHAAATPEPTAAPPEHAAATPEHAAATPEHAAHTSTEGPHL